MTSRLVKAAQELARTNPEFRAALMRELQAANGGAKIAKNSLQCDMEKGCTNEVTHQDSKGWLYCTPHAEKRAKGNGPRVRKLRPAEIKAMESKEAELASSKKAQGSQKVAQTSKPLYDHSSPETAYVVEDYPYGFKLRTSIRYWLESSPGKGFRFVSQTKDPRTGRWNNPKKSTYMMLGGNMFLDSKGHVGWKGLSQYSDANEVAEFVKEFPRTDSPMLKKWIKAKIQLYEDMISGKRKWTINGVAKEPSEDEIGRWRKELEIWQGM